jgi:hypothetical protein
MHRLLLSHVVHVLGAGFFMRLQMQELQAPPDDTHHFCCSGLFTMCATCAEDFVATLSCSANV